MSELLSLVQILEETVELGVVVVIRGSKWGWRWGWWGLRQLGVFILFAVTAASRLAVGTTATLRVAYRSTCGLTLRVSLRFTFRVAAYLSFRLSLNLHLGKTDRETLGLAELVEGLGEGLLEYGLVIGSRHIIVLVFKGDSVHELGFKEGCRNKK